MRTPILFSAVLALSLTQGVLAQSAPAGYLTLDAAEIEEVASSAQTKQAPPAKAEVPVVSRSSAPEPLALAETPPTPAKVQAALAARSAPTQKEASVIQAPPVLLSVPIGQAATKQTEASPSPPQLATAPVLQSLSPSEMLVNPGTPTPGSGVVLESVAPGPGWAELAPGEDILAGPAVAVAPGSISSKASLSNEATTSAALSEQSRPSFPAPTALTEPTPSAAAVPAFPAVPAVPAPPAEVTAPPSNLTAPLTAVPDKPAGFAVADRKPKTSQTPPVKDLTTIKFALSDFFKSMAPPAAAPNAAVLLVPLAAVVASLRNEVPPALVAPREIAPMPFSAKAGASLRETLVSWSRQAEWGTVVWRLPLGRDFTLERSGNYEGGFVVATREFIADLGCESEFRVLFNPTTKIALVEPI